MYLDRIDRRLLRELDHNSRASVSELSKKLKLGNDIVSYRMDKFKRNKVINRYSAYIDVFRLGKSLYKTYLKLKGKREEIDKMVSYLNRSEDTYWLAEFYGKWDLIFSIWAQNSLEYQSILDKTLSKFSDFILDSSIVCPVITHRIPRSFGIKSPDCSYPYGSSREVTQIDELERKILRILNLDARASYVDIAKKLNSSPNVIKYRLNKLEKEKIIFAYQMQFDYKNSNILFLKLLINLSKTSSKLEKKLLKFSQKHPLISCHIKQIGNWPIELEVEVERMSDFHELVDTLRSEFPDYIKNIDTLLLRADHYHRVDQVSV